MLSSSTVYFVHDAVRSRVKIGFTRDLARRLVFLRAQHGAHLAVLAEVRAPRRLEQVLHRKFHAWALGHEWFLAAEELLAFAAAAPNLSWRTLVEPNLVAATEAGRAERRFLPWSESIVALVAGKDTVTTAQVRGALQQGPRFAGTQRAAEMLIARVLKANGWRRRRRGRRGAQVVVYTRG